MQSDSAINRIDHSVSTHDAIGRSIRYLRLSLTKACHMRCAYCRPVFDRNGAHEALTPCEIEQLVRHLVERHGVCKVRLTGGDPTARPDLLDIIQRLARIHGLNELAMTTNGLSLANMAAQYVDAGLNRVNVSLDSLDPRKFARITGVDGMHRVIAGIDAALAVGLTPVKINTVILKDDNEQEMPALVKFASDRGVAIRFIELMPMGPLADQWSDRYVSAARMRQRLDNGIVHWRACPQGSDSATRYLVTLRDGQQVDVGFITPMSCNFCADCNRLRIASDGTLYPCLMDEPRGSIFEAVRPTFDPDRFDAALAAALSQKAPEHPVEGYVTMTHIGG